MHLETSVAMCAHAQRIFAVAAAVERWPIILPHYRFVHVLGETQEGRVVEMAARRGRIPVRWQALQTVDLDRPAIYFCHIRGVTRGMTVEWRFEPMPHPSIDDAAGRAATLVTIHHDLSLHWPVVGAWAADYVIGPQFIDYIASRTLDCIKQLVESESVHATT
jgi:hypothetical protein